MSCLETEFIKEFRVNTSNIGVKDIYRLPLPKESEDWVVSGTEKFLVRGLEGEYISKLNGNVVKKVPRGFEIKRRIIDKATRNFKIGENGYEYEEVRVPEGCMIVISDKKLGLPYRHKAENFLYVDFNKKKDGSIEYFYCLPKTCLYKVNQTALAVSVKNMKNFHGMGYVTWNSGTIYLHVIPYSPGRTYIGSKILKTGVGLDYSKEVKAIVDFWKRSGVIPMLDLCDTVDYGNLVLKETMVGYEDYESYEETSVGEKEIYGSVDEVGEGKDD